MSGPLGNPRWGELIGRTTPSSEELRILLCVYAQERLGFVLECGAELALVFAVIVAEREAEIVELARQHHRGSAAQQQKDLS
ncbi:MAG: hypothetical protein HS104_12620 [Polyangiaceae bacterium]|nr:hypothetical protein [Polyangiaceae bacterium]MBE7480810.1 hypothetical protein [Polyangiaceae bacterium]MCL4840062.1 hypothetical protein [Thermoanaerobaculia bacterium]